MSARGHSRRMDRPDDLAACPLYLQQLPNCPASLSCRPDRRELRGAPPPSGSAHSGRWTGAPADVRSDDTGAGYAHRRLGSARTQFLNRAKHQAPRVDARGSRPDVGVMGVVLKGRQLNPTDDARDVDPIPHEGIQLARHQLGDQQGPAPARQRVRPTLMLRRTSHSKCELLHIRMAKTMPALSRQDGDANAHRMDRTRHRGRDWPDLVARRDF